jgi:hypothetical protein
MELLEASRSQGTIARFSGLFGLSGLFRLSGLSCWPDRNQPNEPNKPDRPSLFSVRTSLHIP